MSIPEGMLYDKKSDRVRTIRVNSLFREIAIQARALAETKNDNPDLDCHFGSNVGTTGFEPATTRPPDVCATGLRYVPNRLRANVISSSQISKSLIRFLNHRFGIYELYFLLLFFHLINPNFSPLLVTESSNSNRI